MKVTDSIKYQKFGELCLKNIEVAVGDMPTAYLVAHHMEMDHSENIIQKEALSEELLAR